MRNAIWATMVAAGLAFAGCKSDEKGGTGGSGRDEAAVGQTGDSNASEEAGRRGVQGGAPLNEEAAEPEYQDIEGKGVEEGETHMNRESGAQPQ